MMMNQLQAWHEGNLLHCHLQHSRCVMHIRCAHCNKISTVLHDTYAMSVTRQHAFLQDLSAVERFFTVAKRIALFLARTSSQQTIDHLVYEISQQISEDGELAPAALSADTGVRLLSLIDSHGILTFQAALRAGSKSSQSRFIVLFSCIAVSHT